jgi:inositol monophosphatase 3
MRLKVKLRSWLLLISSLVIIYFIYRKITKKQDYEKELISNEVSKINLNELFQFGLCLVKEAGLKIIDIRSKNDLNIKNKSFDKSLVTTADLISHQIIVHTLRHKYNNLHVLSEESTTGLNNDVDVDYFMEKCNTYNETPNDFFYSSNLLTVWIDPLDATQEYTENLVDFVSIMFCIAINGNPKCKNFLI